MKRLIAALVLLPAPVVAKDLVFDIAPVTACLAAGGGEDCAGKAAEHCIEATPGGYTTVGMGACANREREWWDARLNVVYKNLRAKLRAQDAEAASYSSYAPKQAEALLAMQRAWIGFRDTKCDFERSQWGGGTGGGPAAVSCHLHETARQTLYLTDGVLGE